MKTSASTEMWGWALTCESTPPSSRWPAPENKPLSFTSAPASQVLLFVVAGSRTCSRWQKEARHERSTCCRIPFIENPNAGKQKMCSAQRQGNAWHLTPWTGPVTSTCEPLPEDLDKASEGWEDSLTNMAYLWTTTGTTIWSTFNHIPIATFPQAERDSCNDYSSSQVKTLGSAGTG